MPTALITCAHLQRAFDELALEYEGLGITPVLPAISGQQLDAAAMKSLIVGADAVIAGDDEIDAEVLEAGVASKLRAVIKWGIGTDSIDLDAAARLGLPVFNTPGAFADEVADLALSHLLLLARKAHLMHGSVLAGSWLQVPGRSLAGLTAGVIGLGSIGAAIARRAAAFGIDVCGYDVREVPAAEHGVEGLRQLDLETLIAASDVIFLACRLTPENQHLLSAKQFARMKEGVFIVNVARGPLIDETALVAALEAGAVAGAGLDVFEHEPLPADDPLRAFSDRCVFTTHNGSNTAEAVARINRMTSDILFDVLGLRELEGPEPNRVA